MASSRSFDSGSNNITFSSSLDTATDNLTLALWIKFPDTWGDSGTNSIVEIGGTKAIFGHVLGKIRTQIGQTLTSTTDLNTLDDGNWHHIATSNGHDGAGTVKFYLDGVLESTIDDSTVDRSGNIVLRNEDGVTGLLLAHFHCYDRQLSTEEINEIMWRPNSIAGAYIYAPIWGLSPEPDLSGNGRDGTVTGTSTSTDGPPVHFPKMEQK